jgi:hypothetical protein
MRFFRGCERPTARWVDLVQIKALLQRPWDGHREPVLRHGTPDRVGARDGASPNGLHGLGGQLRADVPEGPPGASTTGLALQADATVS